MRSAKATHTVPWQVKQKGGLPCYQGGLAMTACGESEQEGPEPPPPNGEEVPPSLPSAGSGVQVGASAAPSEA